MPDNDDLVLKTKLHWNQIKDASLQEQAQAILYVLNSGDAEGLLSGKAKDATVQLTPPGSQKAKGRKWLEIVDFVIPIIAKLLPLVLAAI